MQNPQPIQAAADYRVTEDAIRQALAERGWSIYDQGPGVITALLTVRTHRLFVQIDYDQRAVSVSFVGAENLKAEDRGGVIYAHRKVNLWLNNLQREIGISLARGEGALQLDYRAAPPQRRPPPPPPPQSSGPPPGY